MSQEQGVIDNIRNIDSQNSMLQILESIRDSLQSQRTETQQQNREVLQAISALGSNVGTPVVERTSPSSEENNGNETTSTGRILAMKEVLQLQKLLPIFGKEGSDPEAYCQKVQYYSRAGFSDEVLLEAINCTLQDQAGYWFIQNKFTRFSDFVQAFQLEYCAKQQVLQQQLFGLQIVKGETLDVFAKRVKSQCFRAKIEDEQAIIGYYINGLPQRLKKARGDSQTFTVLQDAVNYFTSVSQILYLANNNNNYNNNNDGSNNNNNNGNNRYNNNKNNNNNNRNNRNNNNNNNNNSSSSEQGQSQQNATTPMPEPNNQGTQETGGISYDPSSLFLEVEEKEVPSVFYDDKSEFQQAVAEFGQNTQPFWMAPGNSQEQVLQAKKKTKDEERAAPTAGKTPIDKTFDVFLQLNGQKASVSLLEYLFQEPQRSQLLQFLNNCATYQDFQDAYRRVAQEQHFQKVYRDNIASAEFLSREQQFQQQLAQQQLQTQQQLAQQQAFASTQNQATTGQQASKPTMSQNSTAQNMQNHRYNTRNNPQPMQYTVPFNPMNFMFPNVLQAKQLPNQADLYQAYVNENSDQPDFSKCVEPTKTDKNKYLSVILLQDKLALTQVDSGSFYSVISQNFAQTYGLSDKIQPSTKKYSTISGQAANFVGQINNISIKFGNVHLRVTLQVTNAQNYTLLLGQDVMNFLLLDVLTSQQKFCYFDSKRQAHFLPAFREVSKIPKNIIEKINSFQGLPSWLAKQVNV